MCAAVHFCYIHQTTWTARACNAGHFRRVSDLLRSSRAGSELSNHSGGSFTSSLNDSAMLPDSVSYSPSFHREAETVPPPPPVRYMPLQHCEQFQIGLPCTCLCGSPFAVHRTGLGGSSDMVGGRALAAGGGRLHAQRWPCACSARSCLSIRRTSESIFLRCCTSSQSALTPCSPFCSAMLNRSDARLVAWWYCHSSDAVVDGYHFTRAVGCRTGASKPAALLKRIVPARMHRTRAA